VSYSFTQGEVVSRVDHELVWDTMCDLFGEDIVKRYVKELVCSRDGGRVSRDERTSLALEEQRSLKEHTGTFDTSLILGAPSCGKRGRGQLSERRTGA
jgi:hypothetical protein